MYLGIDIGSTTSKAVIIDVDGNISGRMIINTGTGTDGPDLAVAGVMDQAGIQWKDVRRCVATGYGRMMFEKANKQITEISCHAKGISHLIPEASTIIDIGGQDAKVISLNGRGNVENFVMNEKCAAGTGRFLEVMARVLDCRLEDLSDLAAGGRAGVAISSICTVFAESEMISQLSAGNARADVALGAHRSIAKRICGMARRVDVRPSVVMSGGAALDQNLVDLIAEELGTEIILPDDPQAAGALGAAVFARELDI